MSSATSVDAEEAPGAEPPSSYISAEALSEEEKEWFVEYIVASSSDMMQPRTPDVVQAQFEAYMTTENREGKLPSKSLPRRFMKDLGWSFSKSRTCESLLLATDKPKHPIFCTPDVQKLQCHPESWKALRRATEGNAFGDVAFQTSTFKQKSSSAFDCLFWAAIRMQLLRTTHDFRPAAVRSQEPRVALQFHAALCEIWSTEKLPSPEITTALRDRTWHAIMEQGCDDSVMGLVELLYDGIPSVSWTEAHVTSCCDSTPPLATRIRRRLYRDLEAESSQGSVDVPRYGTLQSCLGRLFNQVRNEDGGVPQCKNNCLQSTTRLVICDRLPRWLIIVPGVDFELRLREMKCKLVAEHASFDENSLLHTRECSYDLAIVLYRLETGEYIARHLSFDGAKQPICDEHNGQASLTPHGLADSEASILRGLPPGCRPGLLIYCLDLDYQGQV